MIFTTTPDGSIVVTLPKNEALETALALSAAHVAGRAADLLDGLRTELEKAEDV